jgi:hypothetical protein
MVPKCGSCGGHLFRLQEVSPSGSNFKYQFIQCSVCGVPVTAVEWMNIGAVLEGIEERLKAIEGKLGIYHRT